MLFQFDYGRYSVKNSLSLVFDTQTTMKKLLLAGLLAMGTAVNAQVNQPRTCGTDILPQQFETWLQSVTPAPIKPGKYNSGNVQSVFNIPVIVHIIHNNESVNSISATSGNNLNAAQVIDQINILNKDFNGTNADTNLIPAIFKPLLGKFQVNFCLAVVNPTGGILAEPGIDRINRVSKGWNATPYSQTYINSTVKPNSIWNPNKYLNIWVAPLSGGLLGYATFPSPGTSGLSGLTGSFGSTTTDGVVILNTAFGSIGTGQFGQYNKGRTATHEVGHWIGLRHIWGDGNCATDYCNDTPVAQTANYNCPSFPYHLGTCSGNTTGEMTMNFMDYTNDACMYMFTADQKFRAQLILTNSTMRAALITSTVCNLPSLTNDAGISFVASPAYSQSVNCVNFINPVVNVTNYGSNALTSALFSFNVDGVNTQTLAWTGNVAPNTSFTVALTQISGLTPGAHTFSVNVSLPNGSADNNNSNNNNLQSFSVTNNILTFSAPSVSTCLGNSVTLNASGVSTYSWSIGANTASIQVSPAVTTVYTVTGSNGSCNAPKTVTVTVLALPNIKILDTTVCFGAPSVILASGASTYTWSTGATTPSISVNLTTTTSYTLTGKTGAGCTASKVYNIGVLPATSSTISVSMPSCGSCNDATISVTASSGTGPYSYTWTPGNITGQTLANVGVGCYEVKIVDAESCLSVDSVCVSFETGIRQQNPFLAGVKLLPNPTKGEFVLDLPNGELKKIVVTDALGKLIRQAETKENTVQMDLSSFADGVYYVRIKSGDKQTVVKLVKE